MNWFCQASAKLKAQSSTLLLALCALAQRSGDNTTGQKNPTAILLQQDCINDHFLHIASVSI